jgi:hypothetical protein
MFQHACKLGLEGIVCKRRDSTYRSGHSKAWVKVKNPASPAMRRLEEGTWQLMSANARQNWAERLPSPSLIREASESIAAGLTAPECVLLLCVGSPPACRGGSIEPAGRTAD